MSNNKDYQDFLDQIAEHESSFITRTNPNDSYGIENQLGYLGKYQMGELALDDAGYYNSKDGVSGNSWNGQWTGKDGVYSREDFLANHQAQENAIKAFYDKNWNYIKAAGLDSYVGQTIAGVAITTSGLIAGAHLVGWGALATFLKSDGDIVPKDGNDVPVTRYLNDLAGYAVPYTPNTIPVPVPKPEDIHNTLLDSSTHFDANAYTPNNYDITNAWLNGLAISGGNYSTYMNPAVLNGNGFGNVLPSYMATDGWRPGAQQVSSFSISYSYSGFYDPFIGTIKLPNFSSLSIQTYKIDGVTFVNIDPLVLDLNKNGIELTSQADSQVFFDVDKDGFNEQTGWVAANDNEVKFRMVA